MSSTVESSGSGKFVDFDEYIDFQLSKTRAGIKSTDLLTTLAGVGSLVLGYLLIFTLFDHWVVDGGFSRATRIGMLLGVVALSLAWVTWKVILPWWRQVTSLYAAQLIEKSAPQLKSNLINLIDMQRSRRPGNPAIQRALEKRSAQQLAEIDIDHAVDRRALLGLSYVLLGLVTLCCLYAIFSPKPISFLRPLTAANVPVATRTLIVEVTPGNSEVLVRAPVEIRAVVRGKAPEGVAMHYTTADGAFVEEELQMTPVEGDPNAYQLLFSGENGNGLTQSVSYYITAGDARSESFSLRVILAPSATVTQVDYRFPEYMQLEPRSQFVAAIDSWEGTEVTVHAESGQIPVASAVVQLIDENALGRPMEFPVSIKNGTELTARWKLELRPDGSYPKKYRIVCTSEDGTVDPEPAEHHLTIRPDLSPEVALLDPTGDLERPANAVVPLLFKARDPDFQISYVTLRIEQAGRELGDVMLFEGKQQVVLQTYRWELQPLGLKPGDEVSFRIEARDNKHPSGNRKSSPPLKLRIIAPATPQENEQQLQQDEQKQDELLREEQAKQDASEGEAAGNTDGNKGDNSDGKKGKDPEEGDKEGDSTDGNDPDKNEPKPGAEGNQPSDDPNNKGSDPKQNPANDGTKPKTPGESTQPSDEGNQPENSADKKQPGKPNESLNNDGTDDAEALDKIVKHQQEKNPNQNSNPQPEQSNDSNSSNAPSDPSAAESSNSSANAPMPASESPDGEGKGKPSSDPSNASPMTAQPGEGTDPATTPPSNNPNPNNTPSDKDAPKEPSPNNQQPPQRRPGDPDTKGTGKPADKPDPNATRANDPNNIQREPGTSPTTSPSNEQRDPKSPPPENSATDPRNNGRTNPMNPRKNNGEANQPPGPDKPSQGPGNPDAQKSKQPDSGEDGSSQENSDGVPGDKNDGTGDPSMKPGNTRQDPSQTPKGKPSDAPGKGATQAESPDGMGTQPMPASEGPQSTPADSGNKTEPGAEQSKGPGKSADKGKPQPGNENGEGNASESTESSNGEGTASSASKTGTRKDPPQSNAAGNTPGDRNSPTPNASQLGLKEEQNLDHAKQAADLILRKLEQDLQRGEVDEALLKELGWTKEQMQQFADRMRKQLERKQDDLTAEERVKQRQFEEMLKHMDFSGKPEARSGTELTKQNVNGFGTRKLPVPPEYREYIEAVTRDLSKQKSDRGKE